MVPLWWSRAIRFRAARCLRHAAQANAALRAAFPDRCTPSRTGSTRATRELSQMNARPLPFVPRWPLADRVRARVLDQPIFARILGRGRPLVLVHGLARDVRIRGRGARGRSRTGDPDLRGLGRSWRLTGPYTARQLGEVWPHCCSASTSAAPLCSATPRAGRSRSSPPTTIRLGGTASSRVHLRLYMLSRCEPGRGIPAFVALPPARTAWIGPPEHARLACRRRPAADPPPSAFRHQPVRRNPPRGRSRARLSHYEIR
jgi:hypothetical protein